MEGAREKHQVVTSALDITAEILKQCSAAATRDQGNIDKVLSCVKRIMKGECACQDVELEDGEAGIDDLTLTALEAQARTSPFGMRVVRRRQAQVEGPPNSSLDLNTSDQVEGPPNSFVDLNALD